MDSNNDRRSRYAFRIVAATIVGSLTASMFFGWNAGAFVAIVGLAAAAVAGKELS